MKADTDVAVSQFRLILPEASPSLNKYAYAHWRIRQRDKAKWTLWIMAAIHEAGATPATVKRRLTIERHGRRRLDADNLIGGAKGLIDALRAQKMLLEDHDDAMELVARNVPLVKGEKPHTILILEDLP
jgi:hypothetical protein